jgi:hypothetical protein
MTKDQINSIPNPEGHSFFKTKYSSNLQATLDDTATLCRRLAHRLPEHDLLRQEALAFLKKNGLTGSPFRIEKKLP